jgi:hypothetical protein
MRSVIAAAMLVCFAPAVQGAENENPYRNAKVGDWVEYRMTGQNTEGSTNMTVVSKDPKQLTYEVAASFSFMGKKMVAPVQTMKIDLTKSYDAISAANLKAKNITIKKLDEGKEKLKAAGKTYDTKWTKLRATTTVNDMKIVMDYKMWFCKDVPLSGLVRMDTTAHGVTTRVELIASGNLPGLVLLHVSSARPRVLRLSP